jgi:hypothetical protein
MTVPPITLYKSVGVLKYTDVSTAGIKLIVEVDPGIVDYYRALIPPWYPKLNRQMYAPHISVVRRETPPNMDVWGKYEGENVEFFYSNVVHSGTVYWWLNVFCKRLEEIRLELGLPVDSPYTLPPEGFDKCFHMTLGNCKEQPAPPPSPKKKARQ